MTVQIDWREQRVNLHVHGDIYEEQAECLCDMAYSHVRRGIKQLDIKLGATYYISGKGQRCLEQLQDTMARQGVQVSFESQCSCINCFRKPIN